MQLAIDTATDTAGLALVEDEHILAEFNWRCGRNHTVTLLPQLVRLLDAAERELGQLSAITVARGPGSYNGLRVGISAAKSLAWALRIPIVGVSTLAAMAYQHAACGIPVCAVIRAGRGEVVAAVYQLDSGEWQQRDAEHLTTPEALAATITERTLFCGEMSPDIREYLSEALGPLAVFVSPEAGMRRAGYLAALGRRHLESGEGDDPAGLVPLYLRRPHITQPRPDKRVVWRKP